MNLRELTTKEEMLEYLYVLQDLYPSLDKVTYATELDQMLPNNRYAQVAVFEGNECLGLTGYWIGTKLWCGKYLEIDNLVVAAKHRSKGVGKLLFDYLKKKAEEESCTMLSLDSYTTNFKAHKFFYNEGFSPKGFHFIQILNNSNVR